MRGVAWWVVFLGFTFCFGCDPDSATERGSSVEPPGASATAPEPTPQQQALETCAAVFEPVVPERFTGTYLHNGGDAFYALEVLRNTSFRIVYADSAANALSKLEQDSLLTLVETFARPVDVSSEVNEDGTTIATPQMTLSVDSFGCVDVAYETREQTTLCPVDVTRPGSGFSMNPENLARAYGLGQRFVRRGSADGDWVDHGRFETEGPFGNHFAAFSGGANAQLQFPVLTALGADTRDNVSVLFDDVTKQSWDFESDAWWQVRSADAPVALYVMTGDSLLNLRHQLMDLTGKPPVPPKPAFGFWLSEFGFDSWREVDDKIAEMRAASMPLDGVVLDLQWYGGTSEGDPESPMGSLSWDVEHFPNPAQKIAELKADGVSVMAIEQSYVAEMQPGYAEMASLDGLAVSCESSAPIGFNNWTGQVGMIDWTQTEAAAHWHHTYRAPSLIDTGVLGHWTDLGEPERYDPGACYPGSGEAHADVHNVYNLHWHRSIYEGTAESHPARRPLLLSRAGTLGVQRYGAALWSGDIAARLDTLATHLNAAMHMSFVGIDYYGADVGGFWRPALWGLGPDLQPFDSADTNVAPGGEVSEGEMYMQWLANAAWFDIPLRAHVYNCGFVATDLAGCASGNEFDASPAGAFLNDAQRRANRASLTMRRALLPYYYSLAHAAHSQGDPVVAPMVMHFQHDPEVATMGHQRMIGHALMVAVVASHGERARNVYLPRLREDRGWYNFYSYAYVPDEGWQQAVPSTRIWEDQETFALPVYARAGALVPMIEDGNEVVRAFALTEDGASDFNWVDDDGEQVACYKDSHGGHKEPVYAKTERRIEQRRKGNRIEIHLSPVSDPSPAASLKLELILPGLDEALVNATLQIGASDAQPVVPSRSGSALSVTITDGTSDAISWIVELPES